MLLPDTISGRRNKRESDVKKFHPGCITTTTGHSGMLIENMHEKPQPEPMATSSSSSEGEEEASDEDAEEDPVSTPHCMVCAAKGKGMIPTTFRCMPCRCQVPVHAASIAMPVLTIVR